MKKITKVLLTLMVLFFLGVPYQKVNAKEPVKVYFFHSNTCGFCQAALGFFDSIEAEYGDKFDLVKYEISSEENWNLLESTLATLGKEYEGVPFFVIGEESFIGYSSASDSKIIETIEKVYEQDDRYDVMSGIKLEPGSSTTVNKTDVISYAVMIVLVAGSAILLVVAKAKAN